MVPIIQQQTAYDCGQACVESILQKHGCSLNEQKIASEIDGTSGRTIEMVLRDNGFFVVSGNFGWLTLKHFVGRKIPVIVCMDGHWVVITNIKDRRVVLMNPMMSEYEVMSIIKFKKNWLDYSTDGNQYLNWGIAAFG